MATVLDSKENVCSPLLHVQSRYNLLGISYYCYMAPFMAHMPPLKTNWLLHK